jgi:histidinol-phosphatase (PHP family)
MGLSERDLSNTFKEYFAAAKAIQKSYKGQINILVGCELDWIRPMDPEYARMVEDLLQKYEFDFFVGSHHHVYAIPIDYDDVFYEKALAQAELHLTTADNVKTRDSGPNVDLIPVDAQEFLICQYFMEMRDMLRCVKPPVVGHFNLILMKSQSRLGGLRRHPAAWEKVMYNLQEIRGYGGCLEVNTAGWRKGMQEPYPGAEVLQEWKKMGGRIVLSDDSHSISQIGENYEKTMEWLIAQGWDELTHFVKGPEGVEQKPERIADLMEKPFFKLYKECTSSQSQKVEVPSAKKEQPPTNRENLSVKTETTPCVD